MAKIKIPLKINQKRIRTLDELRKNFQIAALLEQFKRGNLRTWLYNWNFEDELPQVEALSESLPDEELAKYLGQIFQVSDDVMQQAMAEYERQKEEKLKQETLQEQQKIERQKEENRPIQADEIDFDWQIKTFDNDIDELTHGQDFFVLKSYADTFFRISYDGIEWIPRESNESWIHHVSYCNGFFWTNCVDEIYYSENLERWTSWTLGISDFAWVKIIWDGQKYIALGNKAVNFDYTVRKLGIDWPFSDTTRKPVIYTAEKLDGPWHIEADLPLNLTFGTSLHDVVLCKDNSLIFCGASEITYTWKKNCFGKDYILEGNEISELSQSLKVQNSGSHGFLTCWHDCCFCSFIGYSSSDSGTYIKYGNTWIKEVYVAHRLIAEDSRFIIGMISGDGKKENAKLSISTDACRWVPLSLPFKKINKISYMDGKLLILNEENKKQLAVGTLKLVPPKKQPSQSSPSDGLTLEELANEANESSTPLEEALDGLNDSIDLKL